MLNYYLSKGYTLEWIEARIKAIIDRKKLTNTWKENGVTYGGTKTREKFDTLATKLYPDPNIFYHAFTTQPVGSYTCDSIRILNILVGKVVRDTTVAEVCGNLSYKWIGKDRFGNDSIRRIINNPETKIYTDVYTTVLGFDSIFYLDLTVYPAYVNIDSMTMNLSTCQYSDFHWVRENNNGYPTRLFSVNANRWIDADSIPTNRAGEFTYIDSLQTKYGCDSVWTLHLRVDSTYYLVDTLNICNDEYSIWERKLYVGSQCFDSLPNIDSFGESIDSVIHVSPQLNFRDTTHMYTINGCDSIRYLSLNLTLDLNTRLEVGTFIVAHHKKRYIDMHLAIGLRCIFFILDVYK